MYNEPEVKRDDLFGHILSCVIIVLVAFGAFKAVQSVCPSKENVSTRTGNFPESALYIGGVVQHRSDGTRFVISSIHNSYCVSIRNSNTYLYRVNLAELEPVTDVKPE